MGLTAYSVSNPANQSSKFSLSEGSDWAAAADYSALSLDDFHLSFLFGILALILQKTTNC